jgi:hypothetical protein
VVEIFGNVLAQALQRGNHRRAGNVALVPGQRLADRPGLVALAAAGKPVGRQRAHILATVLQLQRDRGSDAWRISQQFPRPIPDAVGTVVRQNHQSAAIAFRELGEVAQQFHADQRPQQRVAGLRNQAHGFVELGKTSDQHRPERNIELRQRPVPPPREVLGNEILAAVGNP